MRSRRLSQTRRSSDPLKHRALRSPERGMNQTMRWPDDHEEHREIFPPQKEKLNQDSRRSTSHLNRGLQPTRHEVEAATDNQGLHIPGWEYSHDQTPQAQFRPHLSRADPLVHHSRPWPTLSTPGGPSRPSATESWLRPPSFNSCRYSRTQATAPPLPEPIMFTVGTISANPQPKPFNHNHNRTRSSPANFLCLNRHLSKSLRPRFLSLSRPRRSSSKNKSHPGTDVGSAALSPLRIRTPCKPDTDKPSQDDRSGMPEKALVNITNTNQRRLNSVDSERPRETKPEKPKPFGFTYVELKPEPGFLDATLVGGPFGYESPGVRRPIWEQGRVVHVKHPGRMREGAGGGGAKTKGKDKALPHAPTTPWLNEGTVTSEPFEVVFD